jgi:hypothetical protein
MDTDRGGVSAAFAFMTTAAGGFALSVWRSDRSAEPVAGATVAKDREALWGNVPPRNIHFTDRIDVVDEIAKAFNGAEEPSPATPRSCAVVGLGGVGKTTIAAEYAYRAQREYAVVWWIRSDQAATIAEDLGALAIALHDDRDGVFDHANVAIHLRRGLARSGRWLLIFDNAEDHTVLRGFWPVGGGAVLLTSRSTAWDGLADTFLAVDVLSHDDAAALLRRHTRDPDMAAAVAVAEQLDRLPLALAQAGAYVSKTRTSLRHYRELIDERTESVLRAGNLGDYADTVATTWSVSFEAAAGQAAGARQLLSLCAYLAPSAIPRWLPARHAAVLPEPLRSVADDPVAYDLAVAAQSQYSLLTADEFGLSMHRLVQMAVRHNLSPDEQRVWAGAAVDVLQDAFPAEVGPITAWPRCGELIPHVLAAAAHAARLRIETANTGRLLMRAGQYVADRAVFGQAAELLRQAVRVLEGNTRPR